MSTEPQADNQAFEKKVIYEQIDHEGFHIVGIDVVTSNQNDRAVDDINGLWQRFMAESVIENIPDIVNPEYIYAVYTDYEGDHTDPYRLIIGCKVTTKENRPENMVSHTVPAGSYALFRARGEQPRSIVQTWETIWSSDLKRSFGSDFEVYGPRFYEPGLHEALIHISLDDKAEK